MIRSAKVIFCDNEHGTGDLTFHEHSFYIFNASDMVADGDPDDVGIARIRGVGRGADAAEQEANARLIAAAPLLAQAGLGAYFLCESLLAVREGATDELIREIRDGLKESILQAGLELRP